MSRTRVVRLPRGWRITVDYDRSPIVEAWGYRPLLIGMGVLCALVVLRVSL